MDKELSRALFVVIVAVSAGLVIEHALEPIVVPFWLLTCVQVVVVGATSILIFPANKDQELRTRGPDRR
jgi:hypothetical protein